VSYFASKSLTYPLKFITQKIKKTSLSAYNEPLVWKSNDEIGLLVGEYNRMLENLEQSKKALSQNEKESAWREMAKQVAHEIKNPLTPMKLTLQHLQRLLSQKDETHLQTVDRSINTLLQQIETLSDIATSFSSFAKMPVPKQEPFELISVLKRTVTLFHNESEADVQFSHDQTSILVEGDQQLMGRIFANLIINGIQSVPSTRKPEIKIKVDYQVSAKVRISIIDNGEGIDKAIQDKIFVPNFSTKYAGSGIGLAIAKRGIEQAGGTIDFNSVKGEGTTFIVDLPIMH
jgi:nitrogen fixation/metabolism regulation signal transduction histidine kinase